MIKFIKNCNCSVTAVAAYKMHLTKFVDPDQTVRTSYVQTEVFMLKV